MEATWGDFAVDIAALHWRPTRLGGEWDVDGMEAGFVEDLSYWGVDVQNRTEESRWIVRWT